MLAPLAKNPNSTDKSGTTPIHRAAKNGQTEIVKVLAPLTAHPNAPNRDGMTPIYLAACNGHLEIVKFLEQLKLAKM